MIRKMIYTHNRRRLIRFNLLRKHLCPICKNLIYFDNKEDIYKCKNSECYFKVEKELYKTDENFTLET